MKANAPKRKVFQDAVDLISLETVNVADNGQAMISVEKIAPFHNHPFLLYEGKRLDDMVESVKKQGFYWGRLWNDRTQHYKVHEIESGHRPD